MEPIMHFVIPFVALLLFGVGLKKALPISLLALLPDLDVLLQVHRSISHSILIVAAAFAVAAPAIWRLRARNFSILAFLAVSSHLFFDLFSGYTPILWPLYNYSIRITTELIAHIGSSTSLSLETRILQKPVSFDRFENMSTYVFTGDGLLVSAIMLTATIFGVIRFRSRLRTTKDGAKS